MHVEVVDGQKWEKSYAANARRACFSELLPPGYDRIDFALIVSHQDVTGQLFAQGYITCREFDAESVYLKHGGAFPPAEKKPGALAAYRTALAFLQAKYKRITTLVENTNRSYLKMAIHEGFVPIGIRYFKGAILVELFLEGNV